MIQTLTKPTIFLGYKFNATLVIALLLCPVYSGIIKTKKTWRLQQFTRKAVTVQIKLC